MAEPKDYANPDSRTPPDPDRRNLAAAIRAVYEVLRPSPAERLKFETRLVGKRNGVG